MENNDSVFDNIKVLLGILATIGSGLLAASKWRDSHKQETQQEKKDEEANKIAREDWLINNAFDIVKGLREELDRLREVNLRQAKELNDCSTRIRMLENLLRIHGVEVPSV